MRYVLERSGVDPMEAERAGAAASNEADRVIGTEIEILTSWDLAVQVAQALGPQRLLPPPQDLFTTRRPGTRSETITAALWTIGNGR